TVGRAVWPTSSLGLPDRHSSCRRCPRRASIGFARPKNESRWMACPGIGAQVGTVGAECIKDLGAMKRRRVASAPIERAFPWRELRSVSRRQGTRKPPIYSVHRWWARRPPELYRAILELLKEKNGARPSDPLAGKGVLDPFMGGGTTQVEAQALGAERSGFDTDA